MSRLTLKALRDLWQIKMRAIGIVFLIAAGVSIYAGTYMGLFMMGNTAKTLYKELHLADFQVTFVPVTDDEMPAMEQIIQIEGVDRADSRLILPGSAELKNADTISSLLIFLKSDTHPQVNDLRITSGGYFTDAENKEVVMLEESFANEYGYKVGDTITIGIQGFFSDFKVVGTAINSEYLMWTSNPHFYIPVKGSLGIIYLPLDMIKNIFGYEILNNISLTYARGADPQRVQTSLERILADKEILKETPKEEQFTYRTVERRLKMHRVFLPTIIAIFDIIAFLITFMTVDRMVRSQRREIGVLMALGYGPLRILKSYFLIGLILGVLGSILGCLFSFPLAFAITQAFKRGVGFPIIIFSFIPAPLINGSLIGIGAVVLASILSAQKIVRLSPRQAIRDSGQVYFKGISFLTRLAEALYSRIFRFSPSIKIGFRNLLRHKRLFVFSVLCLAAVLGLTIALSLSISSLSDTINDYFRKEKWDAMVDFDGNLEMQRLSQIQSIKGIKEIEPYLKGFAKLKFKDIERPYQIVGVQAKSKMQEFDLRWGSGFSSNNAHEIILNRQMRDTLGVKIGQQINVITQNNKVFPMKVMGIVSNITVGQAFVPFKTCEKILGLSDECSGVLATISGSSASLEKELHEKEFVGQVLLKEQARKTTFKSIEEVERYLNLYKILSIFVIITLVFTLQTINILERESEYAVLGAIGYGNYSMTKMVLAEVFIISVLGIVLSMPSSEIIGRIIRYRFAENGFLTLFPNRIPHYFSNIIAVFILVIAVTIFSLRYIYKMQISRVIRNKILG